MGRISGYEMAWCTVHDNQCLKKAMMKVLPGQFVLALVPSDSAGSTKVPRVGVMEWRCTIVSFTVDCVLLTWNVVFGCVCFVLCFADTTSTETTQDF